MAESYPPDALERARGGDADAFAALYRAHAGRVYALCLRLCADERDAAELTQDTFVRIWQALGSFRGESALSTWIHRLTVNVVLTRQRTDRRRLARVEPVEDLERIDAGARGASVDERVDLDRALRLLSDQARLVFVLHDVEGYDYREISELTGSSEVALRSQLHRARRQLMEALK
ncbi:MAG TPA: RNA polymerase sigma factor [Longimicrobiales bacterium]